MKLLIISILAVLTSCSSTANSNKYSMASVNNSTSASAPTSYSAIDADSASVNKLKVGQKTNISLDSNPTTGYSWTWINKSDCTVLSCESETYKSNNTGGGMMVGVGGVQTFVFQGTAAGSYSVVMRYSRQWERNHDNDEQVVYRFEVEE